MPGSPNHSVGSSASCPNPLFFSIVSNFLLSFPASCPDLLVILVALQHRARIPYFSASCTVSFYLSCHCALISFVFSGIMLGSPSHSSNSSTSCPNPLLSGIVSCFLLSFMASCLDFLSFLRHRTWILYLSQKHVRFSPIFSSTLS